MEDSINEKENVKVDRIRFIKEIDTNESKDASTKTEKIEESNFFSGKSSTKIIRYFRDNNLKFNKTK